MTTRSGSHMTSLGMRAWTFITALLTLVALSSPAVAADWTGHWVLRSGNTALFHYEIQRTEAGLTARWYRPSSFQLTSGGIRKASGPQRTLVSGQVTARGDELVLSFKDTDGSFIPEFVLHRAARDRADLWWGNTLGPFPLVLESATPVLGPWETARSYAFHREFPTNAEMTRLFEADQAERKDFDRTKPQSLTNNDAARKRRARELLDQGKLQSADDFYHAAFIFQHGASASDFLLAHVVAMAAIARGRTDATWIAAATLDRYLQNSGSKQVVGTQYRESGCRWTMEPYDRDLIPDSLRRVLSVPPLDQQASVLVQPPSKQCR